jgi:hypothetical protein
MSTNGRTVPPSMMEHVGASRRGSGPRSGHVNPAGAIETAHQRPWATVRPGFDRGFQVVLRRALARGPR